MKRCVIILFAVVMILASFGIAGATLIEFKYDDILLGDFGDRGSSPLVTATFDDQEGQGSVLMTLEATNLIETNLASIRTQDTVLGSLLDIVE